MSSWVRRRNDYSHPSSSSSFILRSESFHNAYSDSASPNRIAHSSADGPSGAFSLPLDEALDCEVVGTDPERVFTLTVLALALCVVFRLASVRGMNGNDMGG